MSQEDNIIAVVGPSDYNTNKLTYAAVGCMRRCILEDQDLQQSVDISEQDTAYRLRIVVHPEYLYEMKISKKHEWAKYGNEGVGAELTTTNAMIKWYPYAPKFQSFFRANDIPWILEATGNLQQVDNLIRTYTIIVDRHDRITEKYKEVTDDERAEQKHLEEQQEYKLNLSDALFVTPILTYVFGALYTINYFL